MNVSIYQNKRVKLYCLLSNRWNIYIPINSLIFFYTKKNKLIQLQFNFYSLIISCWWIKWNAHSRNLINKNIHQLTFYNEAGNSICISIFHMESLTSWNLFTILLIITIWWSNQSLHSSTYTNKNEFIRTYYFKIFYKIMIFF